MEGLERQLREKGIGFDKNGNRVWCASYQICQLHFTNSFSFSCFPHVTNIAAKTGLKHVTKLPDNDKEIEDPSLIEEAFPRFAYDVDFP